MKKTEIDIEKFLTDLEKLGIERPLMYRQISDHSQTGFARVIVSEGENIRSDIRYMFFQAKTYYIDKEGAIVPEMTHETRSKGERWEVSNNYSVVLVDFKGQPIPNPNYKALESEDAEDTREPNEREPFLTKPAFDRFAEFLYRKKNPVSLPVVWELSVDLDDSKGYFN